MDFDDLLKTLGEFGRYQKCICFLLSLCMLTVPFSNIGIVFIAGVPEHWCFTPGLKRLNLSDIAIKNLTIPRVATEDTGGSVYSRCLRYRRNYTSWTEDDVWKELGDGGNRTKYPLEGCMDGWVYDTSVYESTVVTKVIDSTVIRN